MTEEEQKIEEMESLEKENVKLGTMDTSEHSNLVKEETTTNTDNLNEAPDSQSMESDSNLKTETSMSNSIEFSQDLPTEETHDDNKEQSETEPMKYVQSSEVSTITDNKKQSGNVLPNESTSQSAKTIENNSEEASSKSKNKINEIKDTKTTEGKPSNGVQIKDKPEEGEVSPKTTKQQPKAKTRSGKMVFCKVHLLDGQLYETDVTKNATGKELFDKVCAYLTLQEKDYFGLQYVNNNVKFWLNNEKKILKQVKGGTCVFDFSVKFYPPEPLSLLEDISRFQLCLQVRFDIFNGKLPCSFTTLAVLGSYMVQAEVGDFDNIDEYEFGPGDSYLDKIEYAPDKSPEMRSKVYELHRTHKGLTPEEAELQYLENAKKLAMYGVDLHQARDSQGVKLMLGVCASGIQVYKDRLRINRFVWPAILKLSYKRNNFYVKKRPTENEKDGETVGFKLENHKMAKRLWKTCVEHHAFFRLHEADPPKSSNFPRFNSRFRYSGRTQKQVRDDVEKVENRPKFDRSNFKYSSMPQSNNMEGYNHGYPDEKDRTDQKNAVTTPSTESGPPPYYNQDPEGYNKMMESSADKPNSMGDNTEDRTDRLHGQGDVSTEYPLGGGDAATLEAHRKGKKSKEDKEREKREKEEEKRRKKEEEKERKRLEKERKQGKGSSEDRTDKLGDEAATAGLNGEHEPGSAGLDSGQITGPAPSDGADYRKDLEKQPRAEVVVDETNNNRATGPGVGYVVAPIRSENEHDKHKGTGSKETDIDGDYNRNGDKLGDDDHRKSDQPDDDKKKGDKSKRKESDKSKDKKSGFFGRLRSPKDKDAKKGKGKETDIDSPPISPRSPDSSNQKEETVEVVTKVEEKNELKVEPIVMTTENNSEVKNEQAVKEITIEEVIEVKTEIIQNENTTQENVSDEEAKLVPIENDKVSVEVNPLIVPSVTSTETEQVIEEVDTEPSAVAGHNIIGVVKREVIETVVTQEISETEVDNVKSELIPIESENIEMEINKETTDDIPVTKPDSNTIIEKVTEVQVLTEAVTVNESKKETKEDTIIPDENIEDDVFCVDEDQNSQNKVQESEVSCNHVGSETGSLSSDSSDDENVCGSYHVESPLDDLHHKIKVETIEEEPNDESKTETNAIEKEDTPERSNVEEKQFDTGNKIENVSDASINVCNKQIENKIESSVISNEEQVLPQEISNDDHDKLESTEVEVKLVSGQNEIHDRKVDEKKDFDIVLSEQKSVSPDGSQIMSVRSERRTETIQKEVITHTRRELKPEEFEKYAKEIEAADLQNRLEQTEIAIVPIKNTNETEESEKNKQENLESNKTPKENVESDEKAEDSIVEVKIIKSENTLEENVEKMKYIDESSGDSTSVKVKQTEEVKEVVTPVVNEEAEKNPEGEATKISKKESMRLKKEEKDRKKKELAEEKERKKKELAEEKEKKKKEKLDEKERIKKEKQAEKERKKKEKEAEKERKRQEKENKKSKKNKKETEVVEGGIEEKTDDKGDTEKVEGSVEVKENVEVQEEVVEERVPTAIALVMAKQKEEEKMEEIDLNEEKPEAEPPKEEEPKEEKKKKRKSSKKDKKEKEKKTPKNKKKHKSTSCFAFSAEPSSDEEEAKLEEKPVEEVKEEIVQEEVKPVEEVKVSPKQKGKGLGWALPGMEELQQKGTKHEDDKKQHSTTSSSSGKAPLAELTEITDQNDDHQDSSDLKQTLDNENKEVDKISELNDNVAVQQSNDLSEVNETTERIEPTENSVAESTNTSSEVGFGADGQMINRVLPEGEGSIDRRMQFIPVTPPIQETKDSLKHTGDSTMPFFDPSSEDTLGRKVPPPVPPKGMRNGFSEEDRLLQDMPPTIQTESFKYENNVDDTPISTKNVPYVKTKTQTVTYEKDGYPYETEDGILISSQSHSTRSQTIETTTYKTEKDGKIETRVEKKVVITDEGDDDDLDHDDLLAEAIRSVTEMNPDLSVERIECMRQIEEVEK